jgi:hypothetical protein
VLRLAQTEAETYVAPKSYEYGRPTALTYSLAIAKADRFFERN